MFHIKFDLTAQEALEISRIQKKEEELKRLEDTIKTDCRLFYPKVQIKQSDYEVINVKDELGKRGITFSENVRESYDCDLTFANGEWFESIVAQRNRDMEIIVNSVKAYIRAASQDQHRHCEWSPDGNHQNCSFKWLIELLKENGFAVCKNTEGDLRIDW
jgi:hypothetical protein